MKVIITHDLNFLLLIYLIIDNVGGDVSRIDKWTRVVQRNAVKCMKAKGFDWMNQLKADCELYLMRYETERSLRLRTPEQLTELIQPNGNCFGIPSNFSPEIYSAYEEVLSLLRAADLSGNWPLSSQVRNYYSFSLNFNKFA